jgi:hypothetical protein
LGIAKKTVTPQLSTNKQQPQRPTMYDDHHHHYHQRPFWSFLVSFLGLVFFGISWIWIDSHNNGLFWTFFTLGIFFLAIGSSLHYRYRRGLVVYSYPNVAPSTTSVLSSSPAPAYYVVPQQPYPPPQYAYQVPQYQAAYPPPPMTGYPQSGVVYQGAPPTQ